MTPAQAGMNNNLFGLRDVGLEFNNSRAQATIQSGQIDHCTLDIEKVHKIRRLKLMANEYQMEFGEAGVEITVGTFNRKIGCEAWFKFNIEQLDANQNFIESDLHASFP